MLTSSESLVRTLAEETVQDRREKYWIPPHFQKAAEQQREQLAFRGAQVYEQFVFIAGSGSRADCLDHRQRKWRSKTEVANGSLDASVGFPTAPASAKLSLALGNVGQGTVSGVWSYQDSRPFLANDRLYSSMRDTLKCVDAKTQTMLWEKEFHQQQSPVVDAVMAPPTLVNGKVFVGTAKEEIACLSDESGKELWHAIIGEPIVFQLTVAAGRVFAASSTGTLYCLETGDARDDDWVLWGGSAADNGLLP